jgi:hypothetical protein
VKITLKAFAFGTVATVAAIGLGQTAFGQAAGDVSESQGAVGSSWNITPSVSTGPAPTTGNGGTSQDNDSWGGNANGTAGFGALAQTFELSAPGTLSSVQLVLAGSPATFNVELYDLGPYPASGYPNTGQQINSIGNNGGGSGIQNLLSWTYIPGTYTSTYDQFTFNGASGQDLVTLSFGNLDGNIQLAAGELYMLSLDPTANADNTWWVRGGTASTGPYNTGEGYNADGSYGLQNFEGKTGGQSGIRDFDLGVDVVPEPSTMALLGMGAFAWSFVRRQTK